MAQVHKIIKDLMDDTIALLSLDMDRLQKGGDSERIQVLYDDKLQSFLANLIAVNQVGLMDKYVEILKDVEKDATKSYIKEAAASAANNG